ncbi:MAG TPA: PIN domain-containing protein [Gemmataceae bacterium]|jgi:predicted nucleic acid-binding protein|nr:PIN domain-containing protein [Gemmataceae bacterium]
MHVLLDTNIVLDVLCDRQPFVAAAKALWVKVEAGAVRASLTATTLATIFYLVRKQLGAAAARQAVADLLSTFDICPIDRATLQAALSKPMSDYEDAIQDAAAELAGIPVIVTRNPTDFAGSTRRIVDAATLVSELENPSP